MPKKQTKTTTTQPHTSESDSVYFLKLVLYIILGSLWVKYSQPLVIGVVQLNAFPVGLFVGLVFAWHDHFQVDRKIEYAILIIMTLLSYFLPIGIVL